MVVGPVTGRKFEQGTVRNIVIIGSVVVLSVIVLRGGVLVFQNVSEKAAEEAQNILQEVSTQAAGAVSVSIASIQKRLNTLAKDESLLPLLAEADSDALESEGENKKMAIESALELRLLLPGNYGVDTEAVPPMSFASIDLLKRAEGSHAPVAAELHGYGSQGTHIAFVSRVTDANGGLVGLLHLSMPLTVVEEVVSTFDTVGTYIEIRQGTTLLGKFGDVKLRNGAPVFAPVDGTKWSVVAWSDSSGLADKQSWGVEKGASMGLIALILLILVAGAGGFAFYRGRLTFSGLGAGLARLSARVRKKDQTTEVVYEGAVKAIMAGVHPGFEKLVPDLPLNYKGPAPASGKFSQGSQVADATAFFKPSDIPSDKPPEILSDKPTGESPEQINPQVTPVEAANTGASASSSDVPPGIFRAYDIRGVVNKNFSAAIVQKIGRAIASEASERGLKGIVVARDGRLSSPELSKALIEGLRASGHDVTDIGEVPTPVLYFAAQHLDVDSGVMLTGSHNGPEYNGLKIVLGDETLSGEAITSLRDRMINDDMSEGEGELQTADVSADYLRRITESFPLAWGKSLKIVVDCGNGVAGQLAPQLYKALGHEVVELFCDIDGNFPNHHPDPGQPENLQALIDMVKEERADLGLAFDGDGDRLGVVDGAGNIIWPDRQMMLLARDVLSRNQGAPIIFDVKCSRYLKAVIESSGGKPLMWKTGHSLIKAKMKEVNAPLAGEMSGHIFFREGWFGFDDALYAGVRVLEILIKSEGTPTEIFAELPNGISTPELRIPLAEKHHEKAMQVMKEKMAFEDAEIIDIDGLRVDFSDGWGLVRPSNTSPFLIVRFEAESEEGLARIQTEFRDLLHSVSADLKLPF